MPKLIALLGSSGSGKSALIHKLALESNLQQSNFCEIFSLDSLSIYKFIDIASAKPSELEQREIKYHALNILHPSECSNAMLFKNLLLSSIESCKTRGIKVLFIVGGSSFFLKSIVQGLSPMPESSQKDLEKLKNIGSLEKQYSYLCSIDSSFASSIKSNDTYRIHKALLLYFASGIVPSEYFAKFKRKPFKHKIEIFCLEKDRQILRERIALRTKNMLERGILQECEYILSLNPAPQVLKSIGISECVDFLQGKIKDLKELELAIFHHTCQLAKRQRTFNKTQFSNVIYGDEEEIIAGIRENLHTKINR